MSEPIYSPRLSFKLCLRTLAELRKLHPAAGFFVSDAPIYYYPAIEFVDLVHAEGSGPSCTQRSIDVFPTPNRRRENEEHHHFRPP